MDGGCTVKQRCSNWCQSVGEAGKHGMDCGTVMGWLVRLAYNHSKLVVR